MSDEQILEAARACEAAMRRRCDTVFTRMLPFRNQDAVGYYDRVSHLLWMVAQVAEFLTQGKRDKAFRWLGFLQGAMWWAGFQTVEDAKRQNMPPGETFSKERV